MACKVTDAIFSVLLKQDLKNLTEIELRDFILKQIKKRKLKPSFPPIVTSGKRAGNEIHPTPTNSRLTGFVIIDFGVIYDKYMSDMTRTIFIGTPSLEDELLYDLIWRAELLGIKESKNGIKCAAVDEVVRNSLGRQKKYFIHMLGHGVGTRIHEEPKLYFKLTKPVLKENMIITIEPGIYIKNKLGIRIEDTCLITEKGCIPLTKSPKHLIVVK
jgi:Xaa-Pro aminopeptidase